MSLAAPVVQPCIYGGTAVNGRLRGPKCKDPRSIKLEHKDLKEGGAGGGGFPDRQRFFMILNNLSRYSIVFKSID